MGRANLDTGRASNHARDVIHQLAILSDDQRPGNVPADIYRVDIAGAHEQRAEKCGKRRTRFEMCPHFRSPSSLVISEVKLYTEKTNFASVFQFSDFLHSLLRENPTAP